MPLFATSAVLTAQGLACRRGGRRLFEALDLRLGPGELITLTGPNGSGKSTLMRMLAGLTPVETGTIRLDGLDAETDPRSLVHYHGHLEGLRDALTARENLTFSTALAGASGLSPVDALDRMGARRLTDLPVRVLSAGQRRRVALARLLTAPRPIWLLDEPLAALDVAGQDLVASLIRDHVAAGGAALVATHQPLGIEGRSLILGGAS